MKIRDLKNMPLFYRDRAQIIGRVEKGVVGDDYRLLYIVVEMENGEMFIVDKKNFELGDDAVIIKDPDSIKSYQHGEDLSVYNKKLGDAVFSIEGRELGVVSDFIVSPDNKCIEAVEVSAGVLKDLIEGRRAYPIEQVVWKSEKSLLVEDQQGGCQH